MVGGTACMRRSCALTELEWTEAGCPSEALFQQEQRLQALLVTVERFELSEQRLTLYGEGGQVLIFERMSLGCHDSSTVRRWLTLGVADASPSALLGPREGRACAGCELERLRTVRRPSVCRRCCMRLHCVWVLKTTGE